MPPQTYGQRWEVRSSLGEGGQAHTFLVTDLQGDADTPYVLKRLKNLERLDRFSREVQAARDLGHANIVRLIDFDLASKRPYIVTEYCAGGSLDKADAFWRKSPDQALELFRQVCDGVAFAHQNGVIHRDLKPQNIFLRSHKGPAVVGDFGICYIEDDGTRLTLTDEAVGARNFTAPELEDGRSEAVSPKSDVYSLGKLLYWILSGKVFARERFREQAWDLKGYSPKSLLGWDNVYMEHVNRLLDLMVTEDPNGRPAVTDVLLLIQEVVRLVENEFNPISKDIRQRCHYCGQGYYAVLGGNNEADNIGFRLVGNPDWRILVCRKCGHLQAFRVDMAERKDWWA